MTSTPVTRPREVVILAEDAGGAAYVGYVWALATAGQDVRATLAHTAKRALRGLPPNVKQVHLGAGAAGADLAPARLCGTGIGSWPIWRTSAAAISCARTWAGRRGGPAWPNSSTKR